VISYPESKGFTEEDEMNATIRIRRAQLYAAMTSRRAQSIAALQEGHRLVYASEGSPQRAALAGIIGYWTIRPMPSRPTEDGLPGAVELDVSLFDNPIIPEREIAVS
jgi:hypothetical protein